MADEVVVEFDAAVQSLDAINAAAYRLIGIASCQIENSGGTFLCRLTPNASASQKLAGIESVRLQFIDLVTDESLREKIAAKTEPVRNLILSLAFGSLAQKDN